RRSRQAWPRWRPGQVPSRRSPARHGWQEPACSCAPGRARPWAWWRPFRPACCRAGGSRTAARRHSTGRAEERDGAWRYPVVAASPDAMPLQAITVEANPCALKRRLLPCAARVVRRGWHAAAERVDVQPAAAGVARVHAESLGRAACGDVHVDALHALLVEFAVGAERDEITQQALAGYRRAAVGDPHTAPVGLAGDRAVGAQQVGDESFLD